MIFRKTAAVVLAVLMLVSVLCACGNPQAGSNPSKKPSNNPSNNPSNSGSSGNTDPTNQNNKATYKVTVYDAQGKPASAGVFVQFLQNGEPVAMQTLNQSGVAEKELEKGDYSVQLRFTKDDADFYYDDSNMTLSKTKTELTIHLFMKQSQESEDLYEDGQYIAYPVSVGNTYVTLKPGRNYFLYAPEMAGEYEVFTSNGEYAVGHYGTSNFIYDVSQGEETANNGRGLSISPGMVSPDNRLVFGVDNPGTEDVQTVLHVVRTGEYIDTSIPRHVYEATHSLTPWKKPANATVKTFNISSDDVYNLVLDDQGFYHLNDVNGPLVVVFLGSEAKDYMTYLAPYDTILKNTRVIAYFRNEDGETYSHSEDYSSCLQEYIGVFDETTNQYTGGCIDQDTGMYPLTEDLKYIIQQHGNYSGWWDISGERYIFEGITVNETNAWLFMCGYLELPEDEPTTGA